ncbi:hypothetical protein EHF33_04530 [Deinococcus psychrotolerans]|uniref:Uncharacterized protein n=1 Tax=Deinococcus psychrotolerans TaxID=2489213 RepID=A0A3G8Y9Q9_9DEIO|nr:hypothetical protein [Deinococcus psychrotolerans]AZI42099.1 hypothetical protein EHF33_04530 [Deinococcus psychrotolerans]
MSAAARPRRIVSPLTRHRQFVAVMWVLGLVSLGALAYVMTLPLDWQTKLVAWIVLTLIADEAGNWFGYSAIVLGILPLGAISLAFWPFLPVASVPEQWWTIFPLIATALLACLVIKHAGGPFLLPFAAALFALPILAAAKLAPSVDATIKFPANPEFQKLAFIAAGIGLTVSLVRQVVAALLRRRAERLTG